MEMTGEHLIAAPRDVVWEALNDENVLRACIPGCEELNRISENELHAIAVQKIGPVKARLEGTVELVNLNPPESYTIQGEGKGGVAGFAKGGADVMLTEVPEGTRLTYEVKATVGGKLAQLGSRLINATARKLAAKFFDNFQAHLNSADAAE
ncbi:CoxG family protein [Ovoidimarina sediminis]|uniref:CoxG family protein n=1 Tax=Ovoidimarina sediminis TaxID=3079856 RepID=UPI00290A9854|nr:carbon monoxide dehydrogenase subunit G [Rhodophyticola sp. MJ-SS7]MDU8945287.1 carbon monoxide dehydrogenase subunit G [Rhodophyticola sp. MJ-SS7]